jgi:hypothetical protein
MTLDEHDIERIADAVVRRLAEHVPAPRAGEAGAGRLIDAAAVARRLGVRRNWVYAHAAQLGAVRLGGGRGRLRFDPANLPDRRPDPEIAAARAPGCEPGRRRRGRPRATSVGPAARSAVGPVRLLPYLVGSRYTIEAAGRRANAPGPTPGG